MDLDWAVELGRHLERMRRVESDVESLKRDVGDIHHSVRRVALLLALWGGALLLTLSSERGPEIIGKVIQHAMARN